VPPPRTARAPTLTLTPAPTLAPTLTLAPTPLLTLTLTLAPTLTQTLTLALALTPSPNPNPNPNQVWRRLAQLEASLGYCFREKRLLREAFTHAAYANEVGG
jgi:hypothetical protein